MATKHLFERMLRPLYPLHYSMSKQIVGGDVFILHCIFASPIAGHPECAMLRHSSIRTPLASRTIIIQFRTRVSSIHVHQ